MNIATEIFLPSKSAFSEQVESWISSGWLVEHEVSVHGGPCCVLPLLAKVQVHKSTTPVRPCLDYRQLNKRSISQPEAEAPACKETLRKWRKAGGDEEYDILDAKKAYLQGRVAPDLLRYQVVQWKGKLFVITRMGFGLSVVPKSKISCWVTKHMADVDNYVDDVQVPRTETQNAASAFATRGLPTKDSESMATPRC